MKFRFAAFDARGQKIAGQIAAQSEMDAVRLLRTQGMAAVSLKSVAAAADRGPSAASVENMLRQLGLMLRSGVSLAEALEVLQESGADPVLSNIERLVRSGSTLSVALREARLAVPRYIPALIAAGEARGSLGDGLLEAADLLRRLREFRSELVTQFIYPGILVASGLLAVFLLFNFVVPKFSGLLLSAKADLPWISVFVLQSGKSFKEHTFLIVGTVAAIAVTSAIALADQRRRVRALDALMGVPLIGPWIARVEVTRWLRVLANLSGGRLKLLHCLEVAQEALTSHTIRAAFDRATRKVRAGEPLSAALAETGFFGPQQITIMRSGERAGALADVLGQLATDEESLLRNRMKRAIVILEPACILAIGACVGVLMVGIMLAVTSLSNAAV